MRVAADTIVQSLSGDADALLDCYNEKVALASSTAGRAPRSGGVRASRSSRVPRLAAGDDVEPAGARRRGRAGGG
jgi:hypothetical protein